MKEIETLADLVSCANIQLLKEQRKAYTDVMDAYCTKYPMFAEVINLTAKDKDFNRFMALYVAAQTLTARIKELEENTND